MVWVVSGPAWGCCFTSIKVCSSHTNSLRKSKKTARKLLFSRPSSVKGAPQAKNSNFWSVFFVFLQEFVCDEQTFIEVKQHPQAGPETTHTMCEKFENFWKNQISDFFLPYFMRLLNFENLTFCPRINKKGPKNFPRLRRGFFLKKGGFTNTGVFI